MADLSDVRRIALSLPETREGEDQAGFSVLSKGGVHKAMFWIWNERVVEGEPKVPNPSVLVVRVANLQEKDALIAADPAKFFTEPHYRNFPAVLVRLPAISFDELEEVINDAWRHLAPRRLVKAFDAEHSE